MQDPLTILTGNSLDTLATLPAKSVHCVVTSPPYYGLRDYGVAGQIGLEQTPEKYVAALLAVFKQVWRVLRDDGTLWLNLGDSYASNWPCNRVSKMGAGSLPNGKREARPSRLGGLKEKDLMGIPWRVAFALQTAGWYLRSDIIWAKRNCMPESVTDRPTRSHEYIFLLTKSARYYYDAEAIKEQCVYDVDGTGTAARKARADGNKLLPTDQINGIRPAKNGGYKNSVNFDGKNKDNEKQRGHSRRHDGFNDRWDAMEKTEQCTGMRNKRDVWTVAPANYPEAHFATFPPDLIKPCILAGTSAMGCCAECGAPFKRVLKKSGGTIGKGSWFDHSKAAVTGRRRANGSADRKVCGTSGTGYKCETIDWHRTCKCHESAVCQAQPCTVLDPFGGSGTTAAVALELGRRAILCELNPDYVKLAQQRCDAITPGLPLA